MMFNSKIYLQSMAEAKEIKRNNAGRRKRLFIQGSAVTSR